MTTKSILAFVKSNGRSARLGGAENLVDRTPLDTRKLARLISTYAPHDGFFDLRISGLMVTRLSRVNQEWWHALQFSSLCIVAQGARTVIFGDEVYQYDASQMIVFSVALPTFPGFARITRNR